MMESFPSTRGMTPAPKAPEPPRPCRTRKPRISILHVRSAKYPWQFHVRYLGQPWKNSHWHTWDEALVALGLRKH